MSAPALQLSYYPGCSGHGTGIEQDLSTRAVCAALGVELRELADWCCCGATPGHAIGGDLALELSARNLAIAERAGRDLLVPCAACFGNLRAASAARGHGDGPAPQPRTEVLPVTRLLCRPELVKLIERRAGQRLAGVRIAPYYGCLLVRPPDITGATDPEDPQEIDDVARACGAGVVRWPYKTLCCGGSQLLAAPGVAAEASARIVAMARQAGADCIVTACPMCHASLETNQWRRRRAGDAAGDEHTPLPVLYLTELVGLALGLPAAGGWLRRHLVDPRPGLRRREVL